MKFGEIAVVMGFLDENQIKEEILSLEGVESVVLRIKAEGLVSTARKSSFATVNGIDLESLDGFPVHTIILMGSPEHKKNEFLKLLEQIGKLLNEPYFKQKFLDAKSAGEMSRIFVENLK